MECKSVRIFYCRNHPSLANTIASAQTVWTVCVSVSSQSQYCVWQEDRIHVRWCLVVTNMWTTGFVRVHRFVGLNRDQRLGYLNTFFITLTNDTPQFLTKEHLFLRRRSFCTQRHIVCILHFRYLCKWSYLCDFCFVGDSGFFSSRKD